MTSIDQWGWELENHLPTWCCHLCGRAMMGATDPELREFCYCPGCKKMQYREDLAIADLYPGFRPPGRYELTPCRYTFAPDDPLLNRYRKLQASDDQAQIGDSLRQINLF